MPSHLFDHAINDVFMKLKLYRTFGSLFTMMYLMSNLLAVNAEYKSDAIHSNVLTAGAIETKSNMSVFDSF